LNETLETAAVRERLEGLGATVIAAERRSPEYLAKFVPGEIAKWGAIIRASGAATD
jgi:hypothetical protein